MRKSHVVMSTLLVLNLLALPQFAAMATEAEAIRAQVISSDLSEAFDTEGGSTKQSALVYITDIEHPAPIAEMIATNEQLASLSLQSTDTEEGSSQEEIAAMQELIGARRAESRARYIKQNTAFAERYIDSEDVVYISRYSPVIITSLDETEVNQLALNDAVTDIGLYAPSNLDELQAEEGEGQLRILQPVDTTATDTVMTSILNKIKASSVPSKYTGEGIVIGMVEQGVPKCICTGGECERVKNDADIEQCKSLKNNNVNICHPQEITSQNETAHSSNVLKFIQAIAPKAVVYCAGYGDYRVTNEQHHMAAIEALLDNNVHIINASCIIGYDAINTYGETAKWLDTIAANQTVTIVKSSGNSGGQVFSGGMAYNCITVGAVESAGHIRNNSGYSKVIIGLASKPDICAFGYTIETEFDYFGDTSMATPQVTGAVALMCQQNSELLAYPEAIKAILTAGVNQTLKDPNNNRYVYITSPYNDSNGYYKYGAGILDCYRNYQIIEEGTYAYGYLSKNSSSARWIDDISNDKTVSYRVSLAYSRNTVYNGSTYSLASLPDLELSIMRGGGTVQFTSATNNHGMNVKITSFVASPNTSYGIYLNVDATSNANMYYGIAWCTE